MKDWSKEKMEEKESKQELRGSEEMVPWRSINQEGVHNLWKRLSDTLRKQ